MSIISIAVMTIFKARDSAPAQAEPAVRAALAAFRFSLESFGIAYLRISGAKHREWHLTYSIPILYHNLSNPHIVDTKKFSASRGIVFVPTWNNCW